MKHGRNPSLKQKEYLASLTWGGVHLNPNNWLITKDTPEELHIVKKFGGSLRVWKKKEKYWSK